MIQTGYFILTVLIINHVLSLPVTPTFHEKDDVEVMKCIVEVLVEVLSKPHPTPVSQECLERLQNDERLVSILRHHNFLKELQDIAVQGVHERAPQHRDFTAGHVTSQSDDLQSIDAAADRSMLAVLGGPGERSILSQKRGTGGAEEVKGETEMSKSVKTSLEEKEIFGKAEDRKRETDETPDNHTSDVINEEEEDEVIKKKELEDKMEDEKRASAEEDEEKRARSEEDEEKRASSKEDEEKRSSSKEDEEKRSSSKEDEEKRSSSKEDIEEKGGEEGNMILDKKEAESIEEHYGPEEKFEEKNSAEDEVGEVNSEVVGSNRWSRQKEVPHSVKREEEEEKGEKVRSLKVKGQQEVSHHSKVVVDEEAEKEEKRSLEVKRLQMMVRRNPEEMREGGEEEGSTSRKAEEPEIESLAAIESELESVAQKLHELRRG
ncbi:hypothetical protein UPYG_G00253860 [Umbra pygmaea]|uniref:Chromogranin-A n=1 Tax=Umbra pygmaea TaxID=75934 RepID=A0ABD0WRZ5_UMBPY